MNNLFVMQKIWIISFYNVINDIILFPLSFHF
jgi:hypothetical protein